MRGTETFQDYMFSYVSPEQRVPKDHPLRPIRQMVDRALKELSKAFDGLYSTEGRPSIAPEKLLRALLLQVLYSIRSERMLMEQLDYNLLFRWFVGMSMDDAIWDPTVFCKNRQRLLEGDVAQMFFNSVLKQAREGQLLSDEHFSVDGTLIEAWASQKSFKPKGGPQPPQDGNNGGMEFRGQKRRNDTHQSTTDPEARLYRKSDGHPAQLCYLGHVLMDNRHGLAVVGEVSQANSTAERDVAIEMLTTVAGSRRVTVGGDKNFDTKEFVRLSRKIDVTPHVAQNDHKFHPSAIDQRTVRHPGYAISQKKRKRIEEIFGWLKTVGMLRKTRHRGKDRIGWVFQFSLAAFNLVRMRNLMAQCA
jgi:transposase